MIRPRVIPVLQLSGSQLVKTKSFANPRYLGDPINAVSIFSAKEADELILLEIECSKQGRGPDFYFLREVASEALMPLTYGGGISSIDDAEKIFSAGFEKISVQSGIFRDSALVPGLVEVFGSQAIVGSIDLKTDAAGALRPWLHSTGSHSGMEFSELILRLIDDGVGEILLTDVDREGSRTGLNLKLVREASKLCAVPLVALGGAGSLDDMVAGLVSGADAIAAGAYFLFQGPHDGLLITYPSHSELESLGKALPHGQGETDSAHLGAKAS